MTWKRKLKDKCQLFIVIFLLQMSSLQFKVLLFYDQISFTWCSCTYVNTFTDLAFPFLTFKSVLVISQIKKSQIHLWIIILCLNPFPLLFISVTTLENDSCIFLILISLSNNVTPTNSHLDCDTHKFFFSFFPFHTLTDILAEIQNAIIMW